ncbi:conserved hypothetical protein [Gloeothece citriformis PCC 7424]|uniref:DUF760 domain-containing protein n=1 Tax=Gloeothece citriformis (strain PCC 7424) TaxID=65393 RepID=B7KL26_GLOC7|nr:conserved hypothetical protein [Gloeothece citriformis PCC 7424]
MMNQPNSQMESTSGNSNVNLLWQYVQSLDLNTVQQLSQPSPQVSAIMERNIVQTLGTLPPENFNFTISTSRENLGQLLVSAMMSGYFLRKAEERLSWEQQLATLDQE